MPSDRSSSLSRRPRVALIVETSLASGREVLRGIARYVRHSGPWSIYHQPRGLEESVPSWLRTWQGDGIIARVQNRAIAATVQETGLPVVDVLGLVPEAGLPLVHVDNTAIARAAAEHLFERGFRQFGFCGIKNTVWSDHRHRAFVEAVEAAGYHCDACLLPRDPRAHRSWEKQLDVLSKWIVSLPRPVGVMVCNDPRGQLVLEACRRVGVAVPEEVAVLGVDDDEPLCTICDPPLSSVVPAHQEVGFQGAALLDRLMAGAEPPSQPVYIPPVGLVTRMSTDVLAINDSTVASAVRFIREHACDGITIDDVVRYMPLSRSTLQRRFRSVLGRSIHDEILRVRLRRARELLAETDLPIDVVADMSGYTHRQYLAEVFKAKFGQTLAGFRSHFRE